MQRIAFLSDIHANLEALEAVLRDVDALAPDLVVVLGDTVNYGPNPRECVELVERHADVVLMGNHEKEVAFPEADELEGDAREMAEWTARALDGLHHWEKWVRTLAERADDAGRHRHEKLLFVHASGEKPLVQYTWPGHPHHHLQLNAQLDQYLVELLGGFDAVHSFCGHTHAPAVLTAYAEREIFPISYDWNRRFTFIGPRTVFYVPAGELTLEGLYGRKCVINPGSVGQPRDQDPRASWALYDGDTIRFRRVVYDHAATAAKVRALPLSNETRDYFAGRLARGE
jgi:predicted phosphodiesterase